MDGQNCQASLSFRIAERESTLRASFWRADTRRACDLQVRGEVLAPFQRVPPSSKENAMRAVLVVGALLMVGCVDPAADLEAFQKRLSEKPLMDAGTVPGDAQSCTIRPGDVEGAFLLAISTSIAPTKPIVALTDLTTPAFQDGTGLALSVQPLAASDRTTPVGASISLGPFLVDAGGNFRADMPGLTVSGDANPITPGAPISADLVLAGNLCAKSGFFCGSVSGEVTSPITLNLEGSTFTLTLVEPGDPVPTQPAVDCRGTLAAPL
jgi:hypothetical protein